MNPTADKPVLLGGKPLFKTPVPITKPTLEASPELLARMKKTIAGLVVTNAVHVREFEAEAQSRLKVKHAVAVNSCTTGLILAMRALGLKGEVLLPSFTFCATGHAVLYAGLTPRFVDCDPETLNIDPALVEKAVNSRTCAVLAVHLFGNPADVDALERVARKHRLKLLFDAAHGIGSQRCGRPLGGSGDAEVFSLSPTKLLTTGEGGLLTTNDAALTERIRRARNYGIVQENDCDMAGVNSRMGELNALLGLTGWAPLEARVAHRNRLAQEYRRALTHIPGITFQRIDPRDRSSFKDFSILVEPSLLGLNRDELAAALKLENVECRKYFYPPLHLQAPYKAYRRGRLPVTEAATLRTLSLPLYSHMDTRWVPRIAAALERVCRRAADVRAALKKGGK